MDIKLSFHSLKTYCESQDFKGWDPYDGLTSKLFKTLPFIRNNRFCKLAWIQLFKRLPFNLRPLVGIAKQHNAKGLALFLSGYCNLYLKDKNPQHLKKATYLADKLIAMQSKGYSGACWGYYFNWQARAFFQPANTPTVVATTYVATAFLSLYKITNNTNYLNIARSACNFVLKDLNRTQQTDGSFAFSYSPMDNSVVYNASLLGSRLLASVYAFTNEPHLAEAAEKSVRYCCNQQQANGAWAYGTYHFHKWVDNFHTGFNLECIADYIKFTGDTRFQPHLTKGLEYYLATFFTKDGMAKYYNNATYPIDIHAPAQLIITLYKLQAFNTNKKLADKVLQWTITNMQDEKGYFYYQIKKGISSKIPYMRWAQSWMFYAFTIYFLALDEQKN